MSLLRLPFAGLDLETELAISQFVIPAGAGATFSNANSATVGAGGLCTFTTNAAHGLTLTPTAPAPPNYFVTFGGSTSASTGTGVLVGNIFRIISIPSTTTFTFWSTISTMTVTSATVIPVFFPNFLAGFTSGFAGGPTQTVSSVTTTYAPPQLEAATLLCNLAANMALRYNPAGDAVILDPTSTAALTGGTTPATAPTWRDLIAASGRGFSFAVPPTIGFWANGTTATSYVSVVN